MAAPASRSNVARELFAPLGPSYDLAGAALSLGRDPSWRRFLVSRVDVRPDAVVLDVATGTAAVALELVRAYGCRVVGVDRSPEMLAAAAHRVQQAGLAGAVTLREARAESLPFDDAAFDALTFTYLLRYVDEPGATVRELARVVRPGGRIAMLEFGVPHELGPRAVWEAYVRAGLPLAGRAFGHAWWEVARFLRPSIVDLDRRLPLPSLLETWRAAGIREPRARLLTFGAAVVVWGTRG